MLVVCHAAGREREAEAEAEGSMSSGILVSMGFTRQRKSTYQAGQNNNRTLATTPHRLCHPDGSTAPTEDALYPRRT